ncbi:MAG: hypothetical protein MUP90_05555 [Gammaproteobacteria bacterium]|nr:hypothetical protein [Gammaproteobacteria bacterium]
MPGERYAALKEPVWHPPKRDIRRGLVGVICPDWIEWLAGLALLRGIRGAAGIRSVFAATASECHLELLVFRIASTGAGLLRNFVLWLALVATAVTLGTCHGPRR